MRRVLRTLLIILLLAAVAWAQTRPVQGVVRDPSGAPLAGAAVVLRDAQRAIRASAHTGAQGRFVLEHVQAGQYLLTVTAKGFAPHEQLVVTGGRDAVELEISVGLETVHAEVTVTAMAGRTEDRLDVAPAVNIISAEKIEQRAKSVLAQAAVEEPGLGLQRTSPTISGVFVRGLTGSKVNVFLDGVRYTTGAGRGGINTFLNLIEPSAIESLEVQRGPSSAQFGSDAIGGTLQFLTASPQPGGGKVYGSWSAGFESADWSWGTRLALGFAGSKAGFTANLSERRINTLRTGGQIDSHSALTRYLGIPSTALYRRTPDTAFTQYGGLFKLVITPAAGTNLTASYMRSQQDGGRRHDQLLGGDGNLVADLRNLMNDFLYLRVSQYRLGWLDQFSATYSFNVQREERVNQGGQGNPLAAVTHEPERLRAHGFQINAADQWSPALAAFVGADYYHERIAAPSYQENPPGGAISLRRGRVPDNARYQHAGIFAQGSYAVIPGRVRLSGAVRYSVAGYRARAADSPVIGGRPLWPDDSLRTWDWTGRAGIVFTPVRGLSLIGNFSRGFRAPGITDLGTIGITGNGFEAAAPDLAGRGATVGSTAGVDAVSTGVPVAQVLPETNWMHEAGLRYRDSRFETELTFFVNNFEGTIEKFALILPPGAAGQSIGGQTIVSQNANGAVFVAASPNPVLIRANYGDARILGLEHDMEWRFHPGWSMRSVATWLHAEDPRTQRPPNIEGGIPAPDFWLKVRYSPAGKGYWFEPYLHASGRQGRLSSLDLSDRRVGAERSRTSIANFFNHGARARGLIGAGADGIANTADDTLRITGETLAQVQNRVLGVGVNSAPLFRAVPGFAVIGVRGGIRFRERQEVLLDFENLTDRNYRGLSWGVDAPGRSFSVRYRLRF
jgi:outer membrane receptor protein involved in Fe transport